MDCCGILGKYILFLCNMPFMICGIIMTILGTLLSTNVGPSFIAVPIILILLGSILFLVALFGCCGALRESHCMSMAYSVVLCLLMILQLAFVVFILKKSMGEIVYNVWERNFMEMLQISMECCGRSNYTDYNYPDATQNYPSTCCKSYNQESKNRDVRNFTDLFIEINSKLTYSDYSTNCTVSKVFKRGCKGTFLQFWDTNNGPIKFMWLFFLTIEFLGFIFASILFRSIGNFEQRLVY